VRPQARLLRQAEDHVATRLTTRHVEEPHLQSGSARLLPRIIAGRQAGPLFLADRRPAPARTPATVDICPVTGRGRLSYERAEYLFKGHSRRISRTGLSLHQLRHSALTTLADANVSLPLLMGTSRHKNLRSLQRYVHPFRRSRRPRPRRTTPALTQPSKVTAVWGW